MNIFDLTGLEFATGLTRLQLGAHAHPRENGITDLSPRSGLTGLATSTQESTSYAHSHLTT